MADLTSFLAQKKRWHSFSQADLDMAANGIIVAADGQMSRAEALRFARAAFESMGMEKAA